MLDRADLKHALETGDVERVFLISAGLVGKIMGKDVSNAEDFWCAVVEAARSSREYVLLKFAAILLSVLNDKVRGCLNVDELDFMMRDMVTFVEKMRQLALLHQGGAAAEQNLKDG